MYGPTAPSFERAAVLSPCTETLSAFSLTYSRVKMTRSKVPKIQRLCGRFLQRAHGRLLVLHGTP